MVEIGALYHLWSSLAACRSSSFDSARLFIWLNASASRLDRQKNMLTSKMGGIFWRARKRWSIAIGCSRRRFNRMQKLIYHYHACFSCLCIWIEPLGPFQEMYFPFYCLSGVIKNKNKIMHVFLGTHCSLLIMELWLGLLRIRSLWKVPCCTCWRGGWSCRPLMELLLRRCADGWPVSRWTQVLCSVYCAIRKY